MITPSQIVIPSAPQSDGSLREAMRNVTKDYDQVRIGRSYPKLEGLLDFLLFLYKIAWPFVVMTTAVKLMGKKEAKKEAEELLNVVDKVQKKFDDGAVAPRSQSSFKTAPSTHRR
ncbi:hypothetical protein WJX82_002122 [Trebouxia sp. C0006]